MILTNELIKVLVVLFGNLALAHRPYWLYNVYLSSVESNRESHKIGILANDSYGTDEIIV